MGLIVIVDGDNSPGANISGIAQLEENDVVTIYFASDNKYFTQPDKRNQINNIASCIVEYTKVPAANCAVDIAIAMKLASMTNQGIEKLIVLISADKHFGTIAKQALSMDENIRVAVSDSIESALRDYKILECENLGDVHRCLVKKYGNREGVLLYKKIDTMFSKKYENKDKGDLKNHSLKKRIKEIVKRIKGTTI